MNKAKANAVTHRVISVIKAFKHLRKPLLWIGVLSMSSVVFAVHKTQDRSISGQFQAPEIVVALSGGSFDLQDGWLYDNLNQIAKNIKETHANTKTLIRHISEFKRVCDEISDYKKMGSSPRLAILAASSISQHQLDQFVECLPRGMKSHKLIRFTKDDLKKSTQTPSALKTSGLISSLTN